jgi:hypothetical protein
VRQRRNLKKAHGHESKLSMDSLEAHCFIAKSITAKVLIEPEFVVDA